MLVCFFILHARLRARRAPGIPCALCILGLHVQGQNSRGLRGEIAEVCIEACGCLKIESMAIH
jgi:hypothetical protein